MGCLLIGMFFVRFWRRTADRLFLFLCWAFFILAIERVFITWMPGESEFTPLLYTIRLVSFGLIIIGIIDKNRRK